MRRRRGTLTKALEKSGYIKSIGVPESTNKITVSMNSRRFVTQEFLCMKPYWVELIKLFLLISNYILSVILPCSDVSESTVTAFSPFFNKGVMFALLQSSGTLLSLRDLLNITFKGTATCWFILCSSILADILSSPGEQDGFSLLIS